MSEQSLDGVAAAVLHDFQLRRGEPALPAEKFAAWRKRLGDADSGDTLAAELLAFAVKLVRELGAGGAAAVHQLTALAGAALKDRARAAALFDAAVVEARAIGYSPSKLPVSGTARSSLFALRLGSKR